MADIWELAKEQDPKLKNAGGASEMVAFAASLNAQESDDKT